MGIAMHGLDWSATQLGPSALWPASLRIAVCATLDSPLPTILLWGPDLLQLYNDAYLQILGVRHPLAMGQPTQQCWPEVWHFNEPLYRRVLDDGARIHLEDQEHLIERSGILESRYFTVTYAPARDESGVVRGVQVVTMETTHRVLAEHKNIALLKAKAFQLELVDRLRPSMMPDEIMGVACTLLGRYVGAAQVFFSEIDESDGSFIIRHDWRDDGQYSIAGQTRQLDDFGPDIIATLRMGNAVIVDDIAQDRRTSAQAQAYACIGVRAHLSIPKVIAGRLRSVLSLHHDHPYHWSDIDIRVAIDMATRVWATVDSAKIQAQLQHSRSMLRKLTANQENVREDERKRIARDIHDELGQNLMVLRLDVSMMLVRPASVAIGKARVNAALNQIDMTIKSVRTIMNDLRPAVLNLGLHAAIEWQAKQFQMRTGIVCTLDIDHDEFSIDDQRATALFRIVQESLTNVLRHACARHVHMTMQRSGASLQVTISDDGIGLGPDCREKEFAFGLAGIEERVHGLGGSVAITNNACAGMTIRVTIPVDASA
ncbi:MAG: signal transduction histidine kinase [Janthinobacterium sp.]|jgi:signal transduction histidine kinase